MRSGIKLISEEPGSGEPVKRQHTCIVRLKMWLNKGDPVRWPRPWRLIDRARLEEDGETLFTGVRIDQENLFNVLYYGVQGMRIGGARKLKVSPQLAYGRAEVPGLIPENAVLLVEIHILEERVFDA